MDTKRKVIANKKKRKAATKKCADLQMLTTHKTELSHANLEVDESFKEADAFDSSVILTDPSSGATSREYQADEFIFLQGDMADAVFYIQSGKVKLTVVSQSGMEVVVASLPEASFFGEGCLAGQPLRLSSASAVQQSTVIRVTQQAMATLLQQKPVNVLASGDNTVLCIDDEPNGLVARKAILRKKGYEVLTALSGPEGLKLFKDNPVNAVVLDYAMPGMDGGQVAAELKRLNPNIKILLLSAYVDIPKETLQRVDKQSVKGASPTSFLADLEQLLSC